MNVPPYIVDVRLVGEGGRRFRLWVPAIILWPLLLVLGAIALVLTLAVDAALVLSRQRYHRYTALLLGSLQTLGQTRGLRIYVTGDHTTIDIAVR
jgi:hypothetical protein